MAVGEIKVVFSNQDEIPQSWREKTVEMRCSTSTKGLSG
jgi:hypothetical protein